jgi:hypothetical protein
LASILSRGISLGSQKQRNPYHEEHEEIEGTLNLRQTKCKMLIPSSFSSCLHGKSVWVGIFQSRKSASRESGIETFD